jgi:putative nucleotidyltransferase with HDIG domain
MSTVAADSPHVVISSAKIPVKGTLVQELHALPLHNATALQVLSMIDDPLVSIDALGRLIQGDASLSTRILQLANSAMFSRRTEVVAIDKAVMAIGLSTVRTFTFAAAFDLFNDKGAALPPAFHQHAVGSAAGSMVLARRLRLNSSDAFSAGLIHDLGQALLYRFDTKTYDAMLRDHPDEEQLLGQEKLVFGMTHAEAAAVTLMEVRFPKSLIEAVSEHHDPVKRKRIGKPELPALVAVGERLAQLIHPDGSVDESHDVAEWLSWIGLDDDPDAVLAEVVSSQADIAGLLRV